MRTSLVYVAALLCSLSILSYSVDAAQLDDETIRRLREYLETRQESARRHHVDNAQSQVLVDGQSLVANDEARPLMQLPEENERAFQDPEQVVDTYDQLRSLVDGQPQVLVDGQPLAADEDRPLLEQLSEEDQRALQDPEEQVVDNYGQEQPLVDGEPDLQDEIQSRYQVPEEELRAFKDPEQVEDTYGLRQPLGDEEPYLQDEVQSRYQLPEEVQREVQDPSIAEQADADTYGMFRYELPAVEQVNDQVDVPNNRGFDEYERQTFNEREEETRAEPQETEQVDQQDWSNQGSAIERELPEDALNEPYQPIADREVDETESEVEDDLAAEEDVEVDSEVNLVDRDLSPELQGWKPRQNKGHSNWHALFKQKASKVEKYANKANESAAVVTLASNGRRLLVIRRVNTKSKDSKSRRPRRPVILLGEKAQERLLKDWELKETKAVKSATVLDFVKKARATKSQQAAVDAMMTLA